MKSQNIVELNVMTESDIYQWKQNVRITLLEMLSVELIKGYAKQNSDPNAWLHDFCGRLESEFSKLSFRTNEAVQSDMLAGEAQDVVRLYINQLLSRS